MRRLITALAVTLVAAALPSTVAADGIEIRAGAFFPRAGTGHVEPCTSACDIFQDAAALYTADKKGWTGATGGLEFDLRLSHNVELGFHVDGYTRKRDTHYLDYTHSDGSEIQQTLELTEVPMGVSLRLLPLGARAPISPYVTVGADLVLWKYSEFGEFIDFSTAGKPIGTADFRADGVAPGAHVAAGVRVPLNYDFALTAEARYLWASQKDMGGDFSAFKIDLTGASATVGLNVRF